MAANINLHQPRAEFALTEHDANNEEPFAPNGQANPQPESSIAASTEQQGQSSGDGSSSGGNSHGTHDPASAPPPPVEAEAPKPSFMRYGLGDTVIMGRPDYVRAYAEQIQPGTGEPGLREPGVLEPHTHEPSARETAFAPTTPATTTATKPIPMPKPSGIMSPDAPPPPVPAAPALPSLTNAPRVGGEAVRQALAADQRNSQSVTGTAPTASDAELDAIDAMLADPINKQLIDLAKPQMGLADTKNWVAEAQIKLYGEARFQDMMYLHRALPWVQNAYASALNNAYSSGSFEINAFNKEYASRSDLMAQAFAVKFGGMPVTVGTTEFGGTTGDGAAPGMSVPVFTVGGLFSVTMQPSFPTGYADGQEAPPPTYFASAQTLGAYGDVYVLGQDIGDHRAMFDDTAVWFDPSLGFVTDPRNLKDDEDSTWDRIMVVATQATLAGAFVMTGNVALFGQGGLFASSVMGFPAGSTGYAAIQGGVGGAIGAVANSAATGRPLTLADLGRSILTGGVMGGLVNYAGLDTYGLDNSNVNLAVGSRQVINWGERLTAILGRSTMQGILQEVTGGRFRDGLVNGVAAGLGAEMSRQLNIRINEWAAQNNVPPFIASQLRMVGQGFSSALASSAANGGQGGVEAFLTDLINNEIGEAVEIDRAEVNQLTTRYNEALRSNDVNTQATVLNNLVDRWMRNHPEHNQQQALEQVIQGLGWTVEASRFARDGNGQLVAATSSTATPTVDRPTAVTRIAAAYQRNDPSLSQREAERLANDYIDRRGIPTVFVEMMIPDIVVTESRRLPFTTGSEIADQILGGLQGGGRSVANFFVGIFQGIVSIARIPFDGWLELVGLVLPDGMFADSVSRNQARIDMVTNIIANIDQLPAQVVEYFDGRLARANQLEAQGDDIRAASERAELAGDMVLMVTNPRAPGVTRILDRLGMDPAAVERTVQGLERTAEAQRVRVLAKWESREREFVLTDANGNKYWDRNVAGGANAADQLAASLERAGFPKPGDGYSPHHLLGFGLIDRRTHALLIEAGITPNAAINGFWMTRETHVLTYGDDYRRWVRAQFEDASRLADPAVRSSAVRQTLDDIRRTLTELKPGQNPPWRTPK